MRKRLFVVFMFFMLAALLPIKANAITQSSAVNWARAQANRTGNCDVDGNGLWCTDLATAYINYLWLQTNNESRDPWSLYPYTTKNAKDYDNYLGTNNNWSIITRTSSTVPQPGDLFVSETDSYNMGVGHIGIVLSPNGSTKAEIIEMSGGTKPNVKTVTWGSTASYYAEHFIRFNYFESEVYTGTEMTAGAGQTIPDGDYEIVVAADTSYLLDIIGTDVPAANGTNVNIWTRGNPTPACDVFTVTYLYNGFYSIKQKCSNLSLDVDNFGLTEGTNIQVMPYNGNTAQQWSIARMDTSDGLYQGYSIQPRCSGLFLDINGGLAANGGKFVNGQNVQQWRGNNSSAQCWQFIPYPPKCTVTLNANGGGGSPTSIQVTYGSTYTDLPTPYCTGYTFTGWYTEDGSLVTNSTVLTTPHDHTLYARWIENQYTVTLNANGGGVYPTSIQVTYWGTYNNLPTPYCTGYTFTGWYKEDGNLITNSTVLTTPSNHTLYAHWTEIPVSGITLDNTAVELKAGDSFTLTATVVPADAFDKTVTWSSSNTGVATVNNGVVTAVDAGTATITAKAGDKTATCIVTVYYEGSEMTNGAGQTIPNGDYEIVVAAALSFQLNIALDIVPVPDETNVNIWQRSDPARDVDVFTLTYLNNGFYSIKQKGTDVALDVYNLTNREAKREETNVQMGKYHGGTNQQWSIAKTSNGNYIIQAKSSGLCLDISGGNMQNGQNVQQYRSNNTAAQDWQFVPYITSCTISDLTPIDADGQHLAAIPRGLFRVRAAVRKPTDEAVTVLLSCYGSDGRFTGFVSQTVEGAAGESVEVTLPVDNSDGSVARLKAFSVASFDNPVPLGEAAVYITSADNYPTK